jgi:hypothetical protein
MAPSRYMAPSLAFQFSLGFTEYDCSPLEIQLCTIPVVSASTPLRINACRTSAAACRRVVTSPELPPAPEIEGIERSRRINSRGSSSNCSISCSATSYLILSGTWESNMPLSPTFGTITPSTKVDMVCLSEKSCL